MLIDLRTVSPGGLPNEVFDEFLSGTTYNLAMVEAMRDHLVHGVDTLTASKHYGLTHQHLKLRLATVIEDIRRVGRINAKLEIEQDRVKQVLDLANELSAKLHALQSGFDDHQAG